MFNALLKNLSILKKFLFVNFIFYNYWNVYNTLFEQCST